MRSTNCRSLLKLLGLLVVMAPVPGCGGSASPPASADAPGPITPDASVECGLSFEADPGLLPEAESAASRWSAATGCDIRVEAGGIPLRAEDRVFDQGKRVCGLSTWDEARTGVQAIEVAMVDLSCLPPYTVLHEMGHAIANIQAHTLSGVMAAASSKAKSTRIDAASLQLVCLGIACTRFQPEG
jgi:hypothetical protein